MGAILHLEWLYGADESHPETLSKQGNMRDRTTRLT